VKKQHLCNDDTLRSEMPQNIKPLCSSAITELQPLFANAVFEGTLMKWWSKDTKMQKWSLL